MHYTKANVIGEAETSEVNQLNKFYDMIPCPGTTASPSTLNHDERASSLDTESV